MPSQSKPNIIGNLRQKYEPHMKLSAKVDLNHKIIHGIEGKLGDLPKIHKTLSKSFGMQRKTLVRVLGLEEKVAELELEKEVLEEVVDEIEEEINEIDEEVPEELDDLLEDIRQGDEPTKTGTKPKVEAVPTKKKKKKKKPIKPIGKKIPKKKKPEPKKKKVSPEAFKRGTSQETIGERLERLEQNAADTAAADKQKKTDEFRELTTGTDPETGEPLSGEDRKQRFLARKKKISADSFKKGSSVDGAEKATQADTTGASDLLKVGKAPDASPGITPEGEEGTAAPSSDKGQSKGQEGILKGLKSINTSVDGIIKVLTQGSKDDKKAANTARKEEEKRRRKGAEGALEKIGGVALKGIQSVLKPAMGIFQRIWEFIKTVFLGRIVMMFFDWMSKNQGKVVSMFKFIKDWWPVMVAGILAIFGPILGPAGWVIGVGALVWWGFNRISAVIKFVTGIFKGVFDFLTFGLFKGKDDPKKIGDSVLKDTESEFQGGDFTGQDDSGLESAPSDATQQMEGGQEAVDQSQSLQAPAESGDQPEVGMNKGGVVPGTGNTDTVPAKLTPGEFVMSKGAVQQYGVDTLENMNAAAGGTNVPTEMTGADGEDGAPGRDANVVISQPKTPKVKGYEGGGEVKAEEGGGKEGGDKKKKGMGLGGILIKMLETNPLFKLILIPLIKGVKRLITGVHNTLHEEKEGAAGAAGKEGAAGVGVAGVEGAAGKEGKTGAGVIAAGKDGAAGVAGAAGGDGKDGAKSKKMSLAQTMFAPHMKMAKGVGGLMMKHPLAQMAKGMMNNPMVKQMGGMIMDSPLGGMVKGVMDNPLVKGFMSTMGIGGEDKKDPLAPSTGAAGEMKLARIQKPKDSPPPPAPKDRSTVAYEKAQQQQQQQAAAEPPRQDLPYFNASAMVSMSKIKTLGITV